MLRSLSNVSAATGAMVGFEVVPRCDAFGPLNEFFDQCGHSEDDQPQKEHKNGSRRMNEHERHRDQERADQQPHHRKLVAFVGFVQCAVGHIVGS